LFQLKHDNGEVTTFHDFPTLDSLQGDDTTDKLTKLGFGYRAKYVQKCADSIQARGGVKWLDSLRHQSYEDVFRQLQEFTGIGKKVADCICLMSLDKLDAVPIDTHIRQIAAKDYQFLTKNKTLTDKDYRELGIFFRGKWGEHAGWAQTILFAQKLPTNEALYRI